MAYTLLGSVSAGSATNDNVTTAGLDTTGATLIVVAVASGSGARTLSDSEGNTWVALTRQVFSAAVDVQLYYAVSPTVAAAHTFTVTSTNGFPAVAAIAYSGGTVTVALADQTGDAYKAGHLAHVLGSLTPANSNAVVVAAIAHADTVAAQAVSAPFTVRQTVNASATAFGLVLADVIQTVPVAASPRFTWTTTTAGTSTMGVFDSRVADTSDNPYATVPDTPAAMRRFLQARYTRTNPDLSTLHSLWKADFTANDSTREALDLRTVRIRGDETT